MNKPANLKPQETVRSQLRLPAELHERLVAFSEVTGRSMNAEIVHRLEQSFDPMGEYLGSMGLRAQIAAERELARSTLEMLDRSLQDMRAQQERGDLGAYPGQAAGKTMEAAIADAVDARDMFQQIVDAASFLLSEIVIAEAKGEDPDVSDIRRRAKDWGVLGSKD